MMRCVAFVVFLSFAVCSWGQSPLVQWLQKKAGRTLAAADAGSAAVAAVAPSLDDTSTSIVDRSDPGKFFNAALSLAGANGKPSSGTTTGSVTVTIYSIVAALQRQSLVDPDLYRRNRYLRRVSFTLGTSASDKDKDGTDTPGALYGVRWRLIEGPDLFKKDNAGNTILEGFQRKLNMNNAFSTLQTDLTKILFAKGGAAVLTDIDRIEATYQSLSSTDKERVDQEIKSWMEEDGQLGAGVLALRKQLEKPRKLSFAYFTTQRTNGGADDHRLELVYDHGIDKRLNWTVNGGFEYRNVVNIGGDRKGGRLASEAQARLFQISAEADTAEQWVTLDFGGEWKALTGAKPYYKAQAKLSIPLMEGVTLPITWAYESRPFGAIGGQVNDSFKRFKFGIAFDPGKLKALAR